MTVPESKLSDTWERLEWYALSHETARSDIATLLKYRDGLDSFSPVYLFWELYRPSVLHDDGSMSPAPKLSPEAKSLVLELLEDMHHSHRVPYEPDNGDSDIREYLKAGEDRDFGDTGLACPRSLQNLLILIHVAAARAFVLKQDSGLSEEVKDCLIEVERSWQRLHLAGYPGSVSLDAHTSEFYEVFHSIDAVSALSLAELSRVMRINGDYAGVLHMMVTASERYSCAALLVMGPADWWPLGIKSDELPAILALNPLHEFLTGMHVPVKHVVETFNLLKDSIHDVNWRQVARDCRRLVDAYSICFPENPEDVEKDENGYFDHWEISLEQMEDSSIPHEEWGIVTWDQFWHKAEVRASDQLSPSEYRKMREDDEKDAAERRLKNYFFGSDWSYLTERTQRRLINADILLNSTQRVAQEALLNELRISTEEMCNQVVWQPLKGTSRSPSFDFLNEIAKLEEKQRSSDLGIADYEWICRRKWYREFLDMKKLDSEDVKFLTKQLPEDMSQLRSGRNSAEHEIGASATPDSPQSFYRGFLGIGRPGILPQLARIGRKLQGHRR